MTEVESQSNPLKQADHSSGISVRDAESLFVQEADLLDSWKLTEWLELLTPDARYLVPPLDRPDAQPEDTIFLIADTRRMVQSRVEQLLGNTTWAENPRSRTRRLITNFRVLGAGAQEATVAANFAVWHFQKGASNVYVGRYEYKVVRHAQSLLIRERRAVLDLEALRPHGKLSFIL